MKSTVSGSTTTTYTYDGDGVRQQTSTGSAASAKTNFVWDVNQSLPQVALERNGSNTLQRQYIYGLKRIRQTAGIASYFHTDQLGSVTNTTSASGASQRTWTYEPYGVIRTSTGTSPTNFVNFTGEYLDPTGLYHLRARQYDPASGRFTRTDPLETAAGDPGLSAYAYVEGRPTVSVDPRGLRSEPSTAGRNSAAFPTTSVNPENGNPAAIRTLSSVRNPNAGDQCTTVPDEITFQLNRYRIPIIDYSDSCGKHDTCYGTWRKHRKNCDDTFGREMKSQCRAEYPHPNGFFPPYGIRDKPGRVICDKVSEIYSFGVWQLGGESWPKIAYTYKRSGEGGCPIVGAGGHKPDVPACLHDQQSRSYPPVIANRAATMLLIARKISAFFSFGNLR